MLPISVFQMNMLAKRRCVPFSSHSVDEALVDRHPLQMSQKTLVSIKKVIIFLIVILLNDTGRSVKFENWAIITSFTTLKSDVLIVSCVPSYLLKYDSTQFSFVIFNHFVLARTHMFPRTFLSIQSGDQSDFHDHAIVYIYLIMLVLVFCAYLLSILHHFENISGKKIDRWAIQT